MGLPKSGELLEGHAPGARFSDDLLKIELSGPKHNHFSVVDVPGLFQAATKYQTVEDGLKVEALAKRYIRDSRTIILYVFPFRSRKRFRRTHKNIYIVPLQAL